MSKFINWLEKRSRVGRGLYCKDNLFILLGFVLVFGSILMKLCNIAILPYAGFDVRDLLGFLGVFFAFTGQLMHCSLRIKNTYDGYESKHKK